MLCTGTSVSQAQVTAIVTDDETQLPFTTYADKYRVLFDEAPLQDRSLLRSSLPEDSAGDPYAKVLPYRGVMLIPFEASPSASVIHVQDISPLQPDDPLSTDIDVVTPTRERAAARDQPAARMARTTPAVTEAPRLPQKFDTPVVPVSATTPVSRAASTSVAAPVPASVASATVADVTTPSDAPAADTVSWSEVPVVGSEDAGNLLQESSDIQTVRNQRRSPVSYDTRIRGFRGAQIYTQGDGAWWTPVRADLDTILSKIDPGLLERVTVMPGPYGLRYGPGLAFLHVETSATPRYECGPEIHNRMGITVRPNGGQVFGRETIFGGGQDWGVLFHYGHRAGSDFEAGDGTKVPSSYDNSNYLAQLGFDPSEDSRVEFRYGHLDQIDTQYAGLFFDINHLGTDSYNLTYLLEESDRTVKVEGWFHETDFAGDTEKPGKRTTDPADPRQQAFNVVSRVERALERAFLLDEGNGKFRGDTFGHLRSVGGRVVTTVGDDDDTQVSLGSDIRSYQQRIQESYTFRESASQRLLDEFDTNQPDAMLFDAGLFAEIELPLSDNWRSVVGARVDTVSTNVTEDLRVGTNLANARLDQSDTLYAFYLNNDVSLGQAAEVRFGAGHAQRAPTLTERYADGIFLGLIQNGFSRIIGTPDLEKERSWQIDASLDLQRRRSRSRFSAFHSWILDYITYEGNIISDPSGARFLITRNTDLATLTGFEVYSEYDICTRVMAFGTMSYIEGRDESIHASLPGMYPLESTLGVRLTDRQAGDRWALEFGARIVNDEDRIGQFRLSDASRTVLAPVESETPGFTIFHVRGYLNLSDSFHLVAGIDNLFDKTYLEHLNLRYPSVPSDGALATRILSTGFSPYFGTEWSY